MRSICFYVWNEYQLASFEPLIKLVNGYVAIENRGYNSDFVATTEYKYRNTNKCLKFLRGEGASELDQFDLIVAHTAFSGVAELTSAKLAFIQYGLAKEEYNYGLWRGLADVNFVFGPYSQRKISSVASSIDVGHPVLSNLRKQKVLRSKNSTTPTVLYAPTWGKHSSLESSIRELKLLACKYNVVLAPHHNTLIFNSAVIENIPPGVKVVHDSESRALSLLCADIVVSDYSGMIFDAFYLGKKVAVIRNDALLGVSEKIGLDSIEHREIDKFAKVIKSISELPSIGASQFPYFRSDSNYYTNLISNFNNADEVLADRLSNLEFCARHDDLRQKVRGQWRLIEIEKMQLKSEIAISNAKKKGVFARVLKKIQRLM
ncbi:CDP-glycerol glycerophosphotransferase family protein [Microbulbifer sp. JMSA002]|uniref:CDP-glycerol glycerophosphotransferase family protein n=1 Tax=Microbulbifer sp. JMSA002 TaxID=3243368 RepID=UPI0040395F5F